MLIFDTPTNTTSALPALMARSPDGVVALRYIAPGSANLWKTIKVSEARTIAATAGKAQLGLIYETNGRPRGTSTGLADGDYALSQLKLFGAPRGAFMSYTSDEDTPEGSQLVQLGYAFEAFFDRLKDIKGSLVTRVCYGAGRTCDYLMSRGLIDVRWPTQSMGFTDTRKDINAGDWDLRQLLSSKICGLDTDQDLMRTDKPLGFFTPNLAAPSLPDEVLPHTASTEDVEALQNALNAKAAAGLTVDGQYGPATTQSVMAFQKAHGLTVDGVAGPATVATLKGLA